MGYITPPGYTPIPYATLTLESDGTRHRLPAFVYAKAQEEAGAREQESFLYCEVEANLTDRGDHGEMLFGMWFCPDQPHWVCASSSQHWIRVHGTHIFIEPISGLPDPERIWVLGLVDEADGWPLAVIRITPTPQRIKSEVML